ncbi:MAG: hypothetical protein ACI97A_001674 [Planctomycetota bacterium]|jgi:hypothetical protein
MLLKNVTLLLAVLLLATPFLAAQKNPPKEKAKKNPHVVMEVDGGITVISASTAKEFKKSIKSRFTDAVKSHKAAKKEAKKEKKKFTDPKPKMPKVKNHGTFKTKEAADEFAERLRQKIEKKKKTKSKE